MNNRVSAVLIVVCLALAGGGCESMPWNHKTQKAKPQKHKTQKHKATTHTQEVVLPRQTGSNLERRVIVDVESSVTKPTEPESKPPAKKRVKKEPAAPERDEPEKPKKPEKPEETPPPPERFR